MSSHTTPTTADARTAQTAAFLKALAGEDSTFEVRVLRHTTGTGTPSTASGYFNGGTIDAAVEAIHDLDAITTAPGIYVTLNPINPALFARCGGRIDTRARVATGDADITGRRWLLIDIDPVRPTGVSSTEAELAAACAVASSVQIGLSALGWPEPVRVVSGNGYHLLYRIDEPADDDGLISRVLKSLAHLYNTPAATIDLTVHNASRITKVPGTLARKGDHSVGVAGMEDRPHRRVTLEHLPTALGVVSTEQLNELAAQAPAVEPNPPTAARPGTGPVKHGNFDRFDSTPAGVRGYLEDHGVTIVREAVKGQATHLYLDRCPVAHDCEAHGTEIAVLIFPNGMISYKNHHNRGAGLRWVDVREALEPGYRAFVQGFQGGAGASAEDDPWEAPTPLSAHAPGMPFPVDSVFPESLKTLRGFVKGVAEHLQSPADPIAMTILAMASGAVAKQFVIEAREGYRETAPIWSLCIMESGLRKSAALKPILAPFDAWEKQQAEVLAPQIATRDEERRLIEAKLLATRQKSASDPKADETAKELAQRLASLPPIIAPSLLVTEATTEGLVQVMAANGGRAIVCSAEGDAVEVFMGRYDDKGRSNLGAWLNGYSGDTMRILRKSGTTSVHEPALVVALMVQPETVQQALFTRAARRRGLLARFCFCVPAEWVGKRDPNAAPVGKAFEAAYRKAITRLLDLPLQPAPRVVRLSPGARAAQVAHEAWINEQLERGGALYYDREWGRKLNGTILRIALTLHCLEQFGYAAEGHAPSLTVSEEVMKAAISITPYLIEHERLARGVAGVDEDRVGADRILVWLERTGAEEFSKRDCFDACRCGELQKAKDLDAPLALLEEHGYIRKAPPQTPPGAKGRPKSPRYLVNPHAIAGRSTA